MPTRTVELPVLKVRDPRYVNRPMAFFVCRAVGLSTYDIAAEAGTKQGVVAAVFTGRNPRGTAVRAATLKLLREMGYRYTEAELFEDVGR